MGRGSTNTHSKPIVLSVMEEGQWHPLSASPYLRTSLWPQSHSIPPKHCPKLLSRHGGRLGGSHAGGWHTSSEFSYSFKHHKTLRQEMKGLGQVEQEVNNECSPLGEFPGPPLQKLRGRHSCSHSVLGLLWTARLNLNPVVTRSLSWSTSEWVCPLQKSPLTPLQPATTPTHKSKHFSSFFFWNRNHWVSPLQKSPLTPLQPATIPT